MLVAFGLVAVMFVVINERNKLFVSALGGLSKGSSEYAAIRTRVQSELRTTENK